jgi:TPP-dependent pyruvate/acetoin dehydrogenase alpha subunit
MTDDAQTRAAVTPELAPADLERLYRHMLLQRLAEERVVKLYQTGAIVGACFTGWGHEAIAVGAASALGPDDVAATLPRRPARVGHAARLLLRELSGAVGVAGARP